MSTFAYAALTSNRLSASSAVAAPPDPATITTIAAAVTHAATAAGAQAQVAQAAGAAVAGATQSGSQGGGPPSVSTFVDAMAALVPAEVLVAHGVILGWTTKVTTENKINSTVVTERGWLQFTFWGLTIAAALVYLLGRSFGSAGLKPWDLARALVPAGAFVLWTMLQKATAFDAVFPSFGHSVGRLVVAVIASLLLAAAAAALGFKAKQGS